MTQTETRGELVLVEPPQPVRYIHTRMPSPAQTLANAAVAAMALLAAGLLAGGFTGRIDIESPVVPVALILLYALAWGALMARRHAVSNAAPEELP